MGNHLEENIQDTQSVQIIPPGQDVPPMQNISPMQDVPPVQNIPPTQGTASYYGYRRTTHISPKRYQTFCIPTVIYAIFTALCLYDNWNSFFTPISTIASVLFISFFIVKHEKLLAEKDGNQFTVSDAIKKQMRIFPYYIFMILLGISICLTADKWVCFYGNIGIYVLGIGSFMAYFNNVNRWNIGKYIFSFLETVFAPLQYFGASFSDGKAYKKQKGKKHSNMSSYVWIGLLIGIPLLAIVVAILASADPVFKEVMETIFGQLFSWTIIVFTLFIFFTYIYLYGLFVKMPLGNLGTETGQDKKYEPAIGITITIPLTVVYLLFIVIQILYLFMNNLSLPDGMSYAEYARQGFFQLLFVAILNVFIVTICTGIFQEHKVLKMILTVMCICTFVMIASSVVRMFMYIDEYNLTYQRIVVLLLLAMTAVLMLGVLIKLYCKSFPLITYGLFTIAAIYVVFAFARPVHIVADYNLNHTSHREPDIEYIRDMGLDAVPDVYEYVKKHHLSNDSVLYENYREEVSVEDYFRWVERVTSDYGSFEAIRGFNIAEYRAAMCADDILH